MQAIWVAIVIWLHPFLWVLTKRDGSTTLKVSLKVVKPFYLPTSTFAMGVAEPHILSKRAVYYHLRLTWSRITPIVKQATLSFFFFLFFLCKFTICVVNFKWLIRIKTRVKYFISTWVAFFLYLSYLGFKSYHKWYLTYGKRPTYYLL